MINLQTVNKIRQIIRCFETGKVASANYGAIALLSDGPGNRMQITYGASQTTEYGMLKTLLEMYIKASGKFAGSFQKWIRMVGNVKEDSLSINREFLDLLKAAATDPIMQQTQDRFFMIYYFNPARQWFEKNWFTLPLSLLVVYDSYVHSGSVMNSLRNKFAEAVPASGGDEKKWINAYVEVRDAWLESNTKRPILQKTDYRTDSFIFAMKNNNWNLDQPFKVVNYKDRQELTNPQIIHIVP
jgi:chitosanase